MRLDAQRIFRVGKDLLAGVQKGAGGDGSAGNFVHVAAKRIRIRRDANELLFKGVVSHTAAETRGLGKRAHIDLRYVSACGNAHGDRNFSAVSLGRRGQRITLDAAAFILRGENFIQLAAVRKLFVLDLLVFAVRQHRFKRRALGGQLLLCDGAFGHLVGDRQRRGSHQRKHEQAKAQFQDLIHAPAPPQSSLAW